MKEDAVAVARASFLDIEGVRIAQKILFFYGPGRAWKPVLFCVLRLERFGY
jgi:hypothetical protein